MDSVRLIGFHPSGKAFGYAGKRRIILNGGIPGEVVDVANIRRAGDHYSGKIMHVREPSSSRTMPFCSHAGVCGGCEWQHILYPEQLRWKQKLLARAFEKHLILTPPIPMPEASPGIINFRNRLVFSFSARRWFEEGEGVVTDMAERCAAGFHPVDNPFRVVDIRECFLMPDTSIRMVRGLKSFTLQQGMTFFDPKEKCGFLREMIIRRNLKEDYLVIMIFSEDRPALIHAVMEFLRQHFPEVVSLWYSVVSGIDQDFTTGDLVHHAGTRHCLYENANGLRFRISPGSFYQPNPAQAEKFFARIAGMAALTGEERILDLYCGTGTISLHLATKSKMVTGIESSPSSVEDAMANAHDNRVENIRFVRGDVMETFTPEFISQSGHPNLVVLDPPRSGTLITVKKRILEASPEKVIYVSCDPMSLADDLKMLTKGYRITKVEPYDQFPHTHHLETLVLLERKDESHALSN